MSVTKVVFYEEKQPREEETYGIDFSGVRSMQAGETIQSAVVEVTRDGQPVTEFLVSYAVVETKVLFRLRGGENGKDYKITVLVTTNAGHVREAEVVMFVREY